PEAHEADLAKSLNNLGNRLMDAGRTSEALTTIEKALEIYRQMERIRGSNYEQNSIPALSNLAAVYLHMGDTETAISIYEQTLEYALRAWGEDHPYALSIRGNLAEAYESAGDTARAVSLYERALEDSSRVLGERHPRTLSIRSSLTGAAIRSRLSEVYESTEGTPHRPVIESSVVSDVTTKPNDSVRRLTKVDEDFSRFYRESVSQLVAFLMWQGASLDDAADIAQDTMIALYQGWPTIKHPKKWTRTVASRYLMRHINRTEKRSEIEQLRPTALLLDTNRDSGWEEHIRVFRLVSQLPARQRQVLAWTLDGFTDEEIAEQLQITVSTARSALTRARRTLTSLLHEGGSASTRGATN
ncbi:sigma-70 family RNA polymerase sigma factor, partial [Streptomyces sp. NPDC002402]